MRNWSSLRSAASLLRLLFLIGAVHSVAWADRWELAYFYDEDDSSLSLNDIKFSSQSRGIAVGTIVSGRSRNQRPVDLITSDGGATWNLVDTKEAGTSLFLLDDVSGWKVTRSGVWFTNEAGRSWTRILKREGLLQVRFVTPNQGWALGTRKTLLVTSDGGKTWTSVPEAQKLTTSSQRTAFLDIEFATPLHGLITGTSQPETRETRPAWMGRPPGRIEEKPSLSITLETRDGGKTWNTSTTSMFGMLTEVKLGSDLKGLALIVFQRSFLFSAEVYELDLGKATAKRVLRKEDLTVNSLATQNGTSYAAGFRPAGRIANAPIPGKVRILSTANRENWTDAPIDYRAVANHVSLAPAGASEMWAATDTGMILHLKRE